MITIVTEQLPCQHATQDNGVFQLKSGYDRSTASRGQEETIRNSVKIKFQVVLSSQKLKTIYVLK